MSDPFIDDSELALDERTYFAQTKQQGFYVSSGEVALLKDKTPKKKSKNPLALSTAKKDGPSTSTNTSTAPAKKPASLLLSPKNEGGEGTRDSPMGVPSSSDGEGAGKRGRAEGEVDGHLDPSGAEEERAGQKRKRYITVVEGGKKRKVVDIVRIRPRAFSLASAHCVLRTTAFIPPGAAGRYRGDQRSDSQR